MSETRFWLEMHGPEFLYDASHIREPVRGRNLQQAIKNAHVKVAKELRSEHVGDDPWYQKWSLHDTDDRDAEIKTYGCTISVYEGQTVVCPDEPDCEGGTHEWKRGPGFASGGGIQYTDTCLFCGLKNHVDCWSTNPEDGSGGHETVRYEEESE